MNNFFKWCLKKNEKEINFMEVLEQIAKEVESDYKTKISLEVRKTDKKYMYLSFYHGMSAQFLTSAKIAIKNPFKKGVIYD